MTNTEAVLGMILTFIVGAVITMLAIDSSLIGVKYFDKPTIEATCSRAFLGENRSCERMVDRLENYDNPE